MKKQILHSAFWVLGLLLILSACGESGSGNEAANHPDSSKFPIWNQAPIPDFAFINQDSMIIEANVMEGHVHVLDFFFTSCPTICPVMKAEMLKVYEAYEDEDDFLMLSHSIDTRHDSVPVLKEYADRLGVSSDRWYFVTGEKEEIYDMAHNYMLVAEEDSTSPGGYNHSGRIMLMDWDRNIRSWYDGTDPNDTEKLIKDIAILLDEFEQQKH